MEDIPVFNLRCFYMCSDPRTSGLSAAGSRDEESSGTSVSDRLLLANAKEEEGEIVEETYEMEVDRDRSKSPRLGWNRIVTVTMICLLTACLFADQNLMAPNLTAISKEFEFTAQQRDEKLGGEVAFAFFLAGAPIALWIGWLADKMPRKWLFCGVVILGEGP
eukprot:467366-Hanusia_phi.AAC.1